MAVAFGAVSIKEDEADQAVVAALCRAAHDVITSQTLTYTEHADTSKPATTGGIGIWYAEEEARLRPQEGDKAPRYMVSNKPVPLLRRPVPRSLLDLKDVLEKAVPGRPFDAILIIHRRLGTEILAAHVSRSLPEHGCGPDVVMKFGVSDSLPRTVLAVPKDKESSEKATELCTRENKLSILYGPFDDTHCIVVPSRPNILGGSIIFRFMRFSSLLDFVGLE